MLTSLIAVVAIVGLLLSAAATGRHVGDRLFPTADRPLTLLASPVLGLGCFALASLVFLALGILPSWIHLAPPLIGFALLVRGWGGMVVDVEALGAELRSARWALLALLGCTALVVVTFALGPVVDWDSLSFHDRVPAQLMDARRLLVPPDNLHVAQLGLAHLASLPLRVLHVPYVGALLSAACAVLIVLVGALAGSRFGGGGKGAMLTAAALAGTPLLLLVSMTPRVDAALALAILLATIAWGCDRMEGTESRAGWAFVLLGAAAGIKFHGIAFAAVTAPLMIWGYRHTRSGVLAGILSGVALSVPYLLVNVAHFGSPVFPFLAPPTLEPWLAGLLHQEILPPGFDQGFLEAVNLARQRFDLGAFFMDPGSLTIEVEGAWYRPSLLLLGLPVGLFMLPRRLLILVVPSVLYTLIVLGISPTTNLRYLLPAVVVLSVVTAAGIGRALGRAPARRQRWWLSAMVLVALWPALSFVRSWGIGPALGHAVGLTADGEYRLSHPDPTVRLFAGIPPMADSAVGSGVLLLLFDARGGAFRSEVLADTRSWNWPVLAQSTAVDECLAGTGITHVLLNLGAANYYVGRGASPDALYLPQFGSFARNCLVLLREESGFVLFRVDPTTARAQAGMPGGG